MNKPNFSAQPNAFSGSTYNLPESVISGQMFFREVVEEANIQCALHTDQTAKNHHHKPTIHLRSPFDARRFEERSIATIDSHTDATRPSCLTGRKEPLKNNQIPKYNPSNESFSIESLLKPESKSLTSHYMATEVQSIDKPDSTSSMNQSGFEFTVKMPVEDLEIEKNEQEPNKNTFKSPHNKRGKKPEHDTTRHLHNNLTQSEKKPFQCQTCTKRFNHKSDLKKHFIIHTGARPFHCLICTKSFTQSSNLYTHIKKIHKIDPFYQKNWIEK